MAVDKDLRELTLPLPVAADRAIAGFQRQTARALTIIERRLSIPTAASEAQRAGLELTPNGGVVVPSRDAAGSYDHELYAVPRVPEGAIRCVVSGILIRQRDGLVGAGSVVMSVGSDMSVLAARTDYILAQTIVAATTAPALYGLPEAHLGTKFVELDGFNATLDAGDTITMRVTTTAPVTTPPTFVAHVFGYLIDPDEEV